VPLHQKRLPIYHGLLYVSSPFRDLVQFPVTFEAKNVLKKNSTSLKLGTTRKKTADRRAS